MARRPFQQDGSLLGRRMYQEQAEWSLIILLGKTQGHLKGHFNVDQFFSLPPFRASFSFLLDPMLRSRKWLNQRKNFPNVIFEKWRKRQRKFMKVASASYLYLKSCSPDDMMLVRGAFHSTAHVKAADVEAVGRY